MAEFFRIIYLFLPSNICRHVVKLKRDSKVDAKFFQAAQNKVPRSLSHGGWCEAEANSHLSVSRLSAFACESRSMTIKKH